MPWTPKDATKHTKSASNWRLRRIWARVANANLSKGEGSAVRIANAAVNKQSRKK